MSHGFQFSVFMGFLSMPTWSLILLQSLGLFSSVGLSYPTSMLSFYYNNKSKKKKTHARKSEVLKIRKKSQE
jgi:hypothetical protein